MTRFVALARKELWHHGALVLGLYVLLAGVGALLLLGVAFAQRTITVLEAHATFVRFFVPLTAIALSHRLVVREYGEGTQRMLEALPIRRWEVVVTKLVLGLAAISIASVASLVVSAAVAAIHEPISIGWIALVAVKTELFTIATFAVFFTMGLTGRWRFPIYLAALFTTLFIDHATDVELSRFGPIALIGERLVLERHAIDLADAGVTLAIAIAAIGIALALALTREGQVAEALARRMSAREKSAVGLVLVLGLVASEFADVRSEKEPFAFTEDEVVRRDPRVAILYLDERHRPAAESLAGVLARDLVELRSTLGIASLPPVHVALHEELDPRVPRPIELEDREGLLVHASFDAPSFDRDALRSTVIGEVLDQLTDGRASFEPRGWVRAGFARSFVERGVELSPEVRRRALFVVSRRRPSFALLSRWQQTEERYGRFAAEALAASAVRTIESHAGAARTRRFVRALIAEPPPWGMAAVIDARRDPPEARLARTTGMRTDPFVDAWRAELERWRAHDGAALASIARARGAIAIERVEGEVRAIRWRIEGAPREGTCALVHASLGPFDAPLDEGDLFREERACNELDPSGERLIGRYNAGDRVLAAIEIDGDALDAPVRIASMRLEVR